MERLNSKNKHYTASEKRIFLEILKKYKNIIELKKSDLTTLKDKELAWTDIAKEYNLSALVTQERSVHQLKKLWSNLKQTQRDALTKERQARFATGGGPEVEEAVIDPDIASIVPNLLETAPIIFTSNMTEENATEKRRQLFDGEDIDKSELENNTENFDIDEDCAIPGSSSQSRSNPNSNLDTSAVTPPTTSRKRQKLGTTICSCKNKNDEEKELKLQRLRFIMKEEEIMTQVKRKHEEHLNDLALQHAKAIYALELRTATAKAELAELLLKQEKEKTV